MIHRQLRKSLAKSLKSKKSILLLGPRQTGKSTLIKDMHPSLEFNLAQQSLFIHFARDADYLEQSLKAQLPKGGLVFIDEVQRIPSLLNTIQYLVDKNIGYQFILTGSSARKLRRGKANLLPGRLHTYELGPLIAKELNYKLNEERVLSLGSLPGVFTEKNSLQAKKLLKAYASTYLSEEIKAEALTKNLEGFTRFLFHIAADATKYLDLSKVSKNIAVPRQTVQRYFEILEDTLIIKRLDAFTKSEKRRFIQHPRFYFFDNGVLNSLLGNFICSQDRKGPLFENLFFNQLSTSLSYSDKEYRLSSYRTDAGAEVDIVLELDGEVYALEVKTGEVKKSELLGFQSLEKFLGKKVHRFVIASGVKHAKMDSMEVIPWQKFLQRLGI